MTLFKTVIAIWLLLTATGVAAMMFFANKEGEEIDITLMSPLEGVLTFEGKPLPNAKLNLFLRWKDEQGENHTYYTDDEGRFAIPEHKTRGRINPFAQLVIRQELTTVRNGVNYEIWVGSKLRAEPFVNLSGAASCELVNDTVILDGDGFVARTVCEWK